MKNAIIKLIAATLLTAACAAGKYDDARGVMEQLVAAYEGFNSSIEAANDKQSMLSTIKTLSEKVSELIPKSKTIMAKYPEAKSKSTMPKELEATFNKLREVQKIMTQKYETEKIKRLLIDPEVKEANEKLVKTMYN